MFYDANSLYLIVMRNNKFPVGKPKFVDKEDIDLDNSIGFMKCGV